MDNHMGLTTFLVDSSFGWGEGGEHEMRKLGHVSINLHKMIIFAMHAM
jgi:hypothetical protein